MRNTRRIVIGTIIMAIILAAGVWNDLQATESSIKPGVIPGSLDSFYPPQSGQPVFLIGMLQLDTFFSGIAADVMDNDIQGARKSYDDFRSQYMKVLEMVPEWKGYYPVEPVRKLGEELVKGDPGRVMEAFGKVGGICHECHTATMVPAQQKYHWGDFGNIKVTDPLSRESVDFTLFKKFLSTNFAGISTNLRQGQVEQARNQLAGFKARFQALKGTCENCHDQESAYYVNGDVEVLLDKLEDALSVKKVEPQKVGELVQSVGRQSCSKCHLVHVPAAMAKVR